MAGYIVFGGMNINYILDEIKVKKGKNYHTSSHIGSDGSSTNYVSSNGRVITCKSFCRHDEESWHNRGHRINDYIHLYKQYEKTPKVLTSPSKSELNGNYLITNMDYTEDTKGNYTIDWEFTEVMKFNVTKKTFRVWGKAVSSANKKKKKTVKKSSNASSNLSSNVKYLLKTCPTMKKGSSKKKCVMSLQKFLQSQGYYKGYKVDGIYSTHTHDAVKNLQKKYKVKATGSWDSNTRKYFQKKYKYPTNSKGK